MNSHFFCRYKCRGDGIFVKNDVPVLFPKENLRFGNARYKLYAIPHHVGSMTHGHYYATILLDDKKDEWYIFNDEHIIEIDPNLQTQSTRRESVGYFYVKQTL